MRLEKVIVKRILMAGLKISSMLVKNLFVSTIRGILVEYSICHPYPVIKSFHFRTVVRRKSIRIDLP